MSEMFTFPQGFHWGSATAAYQVEGGAAEDGRSESIWDVYSHLPGIIKNNDNGDVACDHYHRWKEDVKLMKDLGYKAYRFSISWPRILPDGTGRINQPGLDFYNALIDELLATGITPMATLYHWDIPACIKDGWLNRDSTDAFAEFSAVCARNFGDRVKFWATINEPVCASFMSYFWGQHAPGISDPYKGLLSAHHVLLAHGKAVSVIRENYADAQIGIALNWLSSYPKTNSAADLTIVRRFEGQNNRWFIDPIYKGTYPADILAEYVKHGVLQSLEPDFVKEGDMQTIAAPTDFLGLNYYTRHVYHVNNEEEALSTYVEPLPSPEDKQTEMGWEIYPKALYDLLLRINADYAPKKIYITENGASYSTAPDENGKVVDTKRIDYLDLHLQEVAKAIKAGVPVAGYYCWSFLDNFEWRHGYSQRFGLVYVDFKTQKRTPKDSAYWYSQVIKNNGLPLS
jgi:beta-glucosidase